MSGLEGPAFNVGSRIAIAAARRFFASSEFENLCAELENALGAAAPLTRSDYATWANDEAFAVAVGRYIDPPHQFDREALIAAITPLVGRLNATTDEAAFAAMVADTIEERARFVKSGDALVRFEMDQVRRTIQERSSSELRRDTAWAPPRARATLERLISSDPGGADDLREALAGREIAVELLRLLHDPPGWLRDRSWRVWLTVGRLCEIVGLWAEARAAFEAAAERPGSNRARALLSASGAATYEGDAEGAADLRARAIALDADEPLVVLQLISEVQDREARLERLAQRPVSEDLEVEAVAASLEATSLLDLGRVQDAAEPAARAVELAPTSVIARESVPAVALARNRARRSQGMAVDRVDVLRASEEYRSLCEELRSSRRPGESGGMLARVAECQLLADRPDLLRVTLGEARPEELQQGEVALMLAELAVAIGEVKIARELLDEYRGEPENSELLRASLDVADSERRTEAVAVLDRLVQAGDSGAGVTRLIAAIPVENEIPWSESAQRLVSARDPVLASFARADWHERRGQIDEAQRELARHSADPRALYELMVMAAKRELWPRAATAARSLLNSQPDVDSTITAGEILLSAGDAARAEATLRSVIANERAHVHEVGRAFRIIARKLVDEGRLEDAHELARVAVARGYERAIWVAAYVRVRQGLLEEARRILGDAEPVEHFEQILAVDLYYALDPVEQAIARIIAIADAVDPPDEAIELKATAAYLRLPDELVSDELTARTGPASFIERFPQSAALVALPADGDGGVAYLRDLARERSQVVGELQSRIFERGEAPLGVLADALGLSLAAVCGQARQLPLGSPGGRSHELEAARTASGAQAVVDVSTLRSLAMLPEAVVDAILAEYPLSMTVPAVLEDLIRASTPDPWAAQDVRRSVQWNAATEDLIVVEHSDEEARAARGLVERMQQIATRLHPSPPRPPSRPGPARRGAGETIYGELADVAAATGSPVFTDDHALRAAVRELGIPAFGTLGAIDSLLESGRISEAEAGDTLGRLASFSSLSLD